MKILKKIQYNSPVTLTFALISLLALILGIVTNNKSTFLLFSVYKTPISNPMLYPRLIGHVFGHASFEHYFNNFLIILLIGPMLEEKYGAKNMILLMVTTALVTGLVHIAFFNTALLGASGIAFMMILLSSYTNYQKDRIPVTLILIIIIFIGREIFDGVMLTDNISHIAHIVGGIVGAIMGFFLNKNVVERTKESASMPKTLEKEASDKPE